jgi:hypothetical protein
MEKGSILKSVKEVKELSRLLTVTVGHALSAVLENR